MLCHLALWLSAAASPIATSAADTSYAVTLLGADTLVVERAWSVGDTLEGNYILRTPTFASWHYRVVYRPDGSAVSMTWDLNDERNPARVRGRFGSLHFTTDSIFGEQTLNDSAKTRQVQQLPARSRYTVPILHYYYSPVLFDHAFRLGARHPGDTLSVFSLLTNSAARLIYTRLGADSANLGPYVAGPLTAAVDSKGRHTVVHSMRSTFMQVVTRPKTLDWERVASHFAAAPPLGALSTRAKPTFKVGAATIALDYGRPSVRGRQVWGTLVPFDTAWRLGADLATHITTDRDLIFGAQRIPAGTYTLFLFPSKAGTQLIVSKRTKIWGAFYDPTADLVRIPLEGPLAVAHTEVLSIEIVTEGSNGDLSIAWGTSRFHAPFSVSPP